VGELTVGVLVVVPGARTAAIILRANTPVRGSSQTREGLVGPGRPPASRAHGQAEPLAAHCLAALVFRTTGFLHNIRVKVVPDGSVVVVVVALATV
jgi:hypothetical protein